MRIIVLTTLALTVVGAALADTGTPRDMRLVQAARIGDATTALMLLNARVDPNSAEPDGTTPLHWAVRNNDAGLVERLIRAGADANAANRYGVTSIALACESGSAAIVEALLRGGVSANATGPLGETALHTCAYAGNVEAAKILIAQGASVDVGESWRGQTPLMWAAARRHPAMMRVLIEAGADVNARSTIINWERQRTAEPRDKWLPPGGLTPLLFAAREGCVDCAKVLLSAGADPDLVDPDRHTPLIIALMNGHFDVAGALVDAGANLDMEDKVGRTALMAAVDAHTVPSSNRPVPRETDDELSSLDIVKKILDRGANVDVPLRAQIPYRTKLDRGGDGVLGAGTTPLLRAAKAGDVTVVRMLLEKGANPLTTTSRGNVNAIMMAANVAAREEDMTGRNKTEKAAIETVRLLLAAGTDINAVDSQGRTAAHGAALWGMTDVVRFLHENGARLDVTDKRGYTALDTALGLSGGFGFDGRAGVAHEETAKVIRELGGSPGNPVPAAAQTPRRNQDDPQDGDRN